MIHHLNDKVTVRIPGTILQFGDIAIIKTVDHYLDKPYYCFCALRNAGEWMKERWLDKHMERPPKRMIPERIKFFASQKSDVEIVRPPSTYSNLPSPYGIADELKKNNDEKTN